MVGAIIIEIRIMYLKNKKTVAMSHAWGEK